jgi:hypothetical protein
LHHGLLGAHLAAATATSAAATLHHGLLGAHLAAAAPDFTRVPCRTLLTASSFQHLPVHNLFLEVFFAVCLGHFFLMGAPQGNGPCQDQRTEPAHSPVTHGEISSFLRQIGAYRSHDPGDSKARRQVDPLRK